jgi:beta-lactamase class A
MKINLRTSIFSLIFLLVGFGIGLFFYKFGFFNFGAFCDKSKFQYINQELACGNSPAVGKQAYVKLKNEIENLIQQKTIENQVSDVAVYFRDLQNGPTMGINEYAKFIPASLLKLPLLVSYLNLAEERPTLFEKELIFHKNGDPAIKQLIPPKDSVQEGVFYTVDDLLARMISYSDNQAYYVLLQYLAQISPGKDLLKETLRDLGVIDPKDVADETITVKSYSSIFIQLYHASFLGKKELSEKALVLLANTDFQKGIEAGVPAGVKVAHKFGEREFQDGRKQLHDCGIVYYPGNPYLVCVMTRGDDLDKLAGAISLISKMVYEEFDSRKL